MDPLTIMMLTNMMSSQNNEDGTEGTTTIPPNIQLYTAGAGIAGDLLSTITDRHIREANPNNPFVQNAVSGSSWGDVFNTGNKKTAALSNIANSTIDYTGIKNNDNLLNAWNSNDLQDDINKASGWDRAGSMLGSTLSDAATGAAIGSAVPVIGTAIGAGIGALSGLGRGIASWITGSNAEDELQKATERANRAQVNNYYGTAKANNARQQRQAMLNYFGFGGDLDNGVTMFNVGGSHSENPLGGIPQGIASDGLPNEVEEGEVKYKDYIYSNRLKPSKTLIKDILLPEKYAGLTYAKLAEKLQKESEDRPNDPISKTTLDEWMSRLANAQEIQKAQIEERRLAKAIDSMSDEEKAAIMSSLVQPMAQQEGIDLSQPMYASGGKIHIKPENRGKFTALKKRTGKTTEELTHSKNPLTRKRAIFAQNARKWNHKGAYGLNLDIPPYADISSPYYGLEVIEPEEKQPLKLNVTEIPTLNFLDIVASNQPSRTGAPWAESYAEETPITETPRAAAIRAAAHPETQDIAYEYWKSQQNPDLFKNVSYDESKQKKKDLATPPPQRKGINFNLENLRFAPAIGAGLGALTAALQPIDYSFANQLQELASRVNPIAAPHIGGYRRYNSYDVNLGDAENLAMQATTLRANRGQNRATQGALDVATINAFQRANAQRNLAAQQSNEANRLNVDKYNLGINQFNTNLTSAYDQLNTNRLAQRLALEQAAIQAADVSKTAWANNINANTENFFNQLGNVGKDTWNANQYDKWLSQHQAVKNIMTGTSSNVTKIKKLKALGYNDEQIKEIEELYS